MSMLIIILFLRPYLYQLHHSNWVEEVKATESVLPVGGAGDVTDRQRGRVTGKDGVPKERNQHISQTSVNKAEMCPFIAIINFPFTVVLNLLRQAVSGRDACWCPLCTLLPSCGYSWVLSLDNGFTTSHWSLKFVIF